MADNVDESTQSLYKKAKPIEGNENSDRNVDIKKESVDNTNTSIFLLICIIGVSLGIFLEILNVQNRNEKHENDTTNKLVNKYWVYSAYNDVDNRNGLLKHVHLVLKRIGYEKTTNETPWNLLWSHDYPFRSLYPNLHRLKPYQKVNHFPGTGFITNKVNLATSNSKYIPKAFKLPEDKEEFLKYAAKYKKSMFLEKNNLHRGVYLKNVTEIDLSSGRTFVQEYIQNPFLVDGHKFDIGVYVVLTSVNPLRVYWYKGDVLFRYCPAKYYPFDPKNLDKYVIGDDYLPTWEVPSLAHIYTAMGFSMKDAFDTYVKSKGKDSSRMWSEIERAITDIFLMKEHHIIEALKNYPSQDNFFELMRFDLIVDEDLKVYLLEANMSPNLSSAHYPPNQLLYEQIIYNLFSLTGVANHMNEYNALNHREITAIRNMMSSEKNIAVFADECSTNCKERCEDNLPVCELCRPCLSAMLKNSLLKAHTEFLHRGDFRRLFPPAMKPKSMEDQLKNMTLINKLQFLWYQGKCDLDVTWCT